MLNALVWTIWFTNYLLKAEGELGSVNLILLLEPARAGVNCKFVMFRLPLSYRFMTNYDGLSIVSSVKTSMFLVTLFVLPTKPLCELIDLSGDGLGLSVFLVLKPAIRLL